MRRVLVVVVALLVAVGAVAQTSTPYAKRVKRVAFADLGAPLASSIYYCTNCTAAAPCTSGGTGAFAFRVGSAWNCNVGSPASAGADTALSNLASVAINASLTPGTDEAVNLGSTTKRWGALYFSGGALHWIASGHDNTIGWSDGVGPAFGDGVAPATLTFNLQALTTGRTATWQNAVGTVALSSNNLSFFSSTTSAQLASLLSDEQGSGGGVVFATGPTITSLVATFTDVTTGDVTSSAHGLAPKGDGDTTKFLNANGAYSTPAGLSGLGSTDNAVLRADGTGGSTAQGSDLVVSDPASNVVTLSATSTNRLQVAYNGATSGTATVKAPAIAGTTTVTLPNADSTLPIFPQQITYTGPTAPRTITLPDANFTVARTDAAQTLNGTQTVKGSGTGTSSSLSVTDSADAVRFKVRDDGATIIDTNSVTSGAPLFEVKYNGSSRANLDFNGALTISSKIITGSQGVSFGAGQVDVSSTTGVLTYVGGTATGGAGWVDGQVAELITLSTSGTTTDSSANLLPANSIIQFVSCRVTTTITTATDWSVGDATTPARFSSANATMTSGTSSVGLNHMKGSVTTDAAGPTQTSAAKLRITTTGTPGAGVVRCVVKYLQGIAPTS